uniref:Uncharacterized protein n=1 Tax=Caenorhabditis tropicalis TaxID=1561998 RepID=A0A1I7ULZ1_9PELO
MDEFSSVRSVRSSVRPRSVRFGPLLTQKCTADENGRTSDGRTADGRGPSASNFVRMEALVGKSITMRS